MEGLRNTPGFFGTSASLLADINLVVHILMFIVLCLGVAAQLNRKYHWHDRLQIPVVVLNFFFILFVMVPSFLAILPQLPENLSQSFFLVPTLHALLGTLAQGVATYCLLAGLKILPRKLGVLRYWMWAAFTLWTLTTIMGIAIYLVWYTGSPATSGAAVAEHDGDLISEHAGPALESPATQPPAAEVEEHAEAPIVEEEPVELVEEHAAEEGAEEAGDPLVEEHAAEPVEAAPAPTATPTPLPTAVPAPVRVGLLTISDGQIHGDRATLILTGVTPPPAGSVYEAWLAGENEPPFSLGKLTLTGDTINHTFTDPAGRNLLGLYNRAFISVEPAGESDPAPSGTVAYQGEVPVAVMEQVRLAVVASPNTPDGDGPALNALNQILEIAPEVGFQRDYSLVNNDLPALKIQAEGIINIMEGRSGPNYGDADGNGEIYDPGDGFGLLGSGEGAGYLQAVINAAVTAGQAQGASPEVRLKAEQVQITARNSIGWLEQLRELELQLLNAPDTASQADTVAQAVQLVDQLTDAGGAGLTDPSQGGVRAVYTYGQAMGAIEIFRVAPQPELIDEHAADLEHAGDAANPPPELIDEHAADAEHDDDDNSGPGGGGNSGPGGGGGNSGPGGGGDDNNDNNSGPGGGGDNNNDNNDNNSGSGGGGDNNNDNNDNNSGSGGGGDDNGSDDDDN